MKEPERLSILEELQPVSSSSGAMRWFFAAGLCAVAVRVLICVALHLRIDVSLEQIVAGHDGVEYLKFADALASLRPELIPEDSRRHDPGWSALIALFSWAAPLPYVAAVLGALFTIGGSVMTGLLFRIAGATDTQSRTAALAVGLIYPTQVYFGLFALTEPAFTFVLLSAVVSYLSNRTKTAYALCAAAMLIRAPGVFLTCALAANDLLRKRPAGVVYSVLSLAPWLAWTFLSSRVWGSGSVEMLDITMSYPFSGFAGYREVSLIRVAYVSVSVAAFVYAVALIVREARHERSKSEFLTVAATFCCVFLLFHLCLRTYSYHGRTIWPFNYQDRLCAPMLPLCLWPFRSLLRAWMIGAAAIVSMALAWYWSVNYFQAALP
jgi:hypothetical protein